MQTTASGGHLSLRVQEILYFFLSLTVWPILVQETTVKQLIASVQRLTLEGRESISTTRKGPDKANDGVSTNI